MGIKIIEKKENPLLARTKILAEISFEKATPSNDEVKKQIASEVKADENLVVVKNIYTQYGSTSAKVTAFVYNSKEDLEKIEPKPKKEEKKPGEQPAEKAEAPKKTPKEEAKPAEAPKGEAKEEAPAKEEKKEEAKPAEEKKE
ncbi:ribosomal protein S24E [Thermoplasmatales archaeon SCGC AB-539-C06]|nr:ribosomal protein S24E [Thermoplasmatales archaeon SCGC AB-539-C06]